MYQDVASARRTEISYLLGYACQLAFQQNQPGQARLAYERGVQYLRKQADPAPYGQSLKAFEAQLVRANALLQSTLEPSSDEVNALTEGLKTDEAEGDWKKKAIYDWRKCMVYQVCLSLI